MVYQTLFSKKYVSRKVNLNLRMFKIEFTKDLKSTSKSMGVTDAFDEKIADLNPINSEMEFCLSEVVHST